MNYYNVFYWLTVADGVKSVFDTFSNLFTFFTVISLILYVVMIGVNIEYVPKASEEDKKSIHFWHRFAARTFWISFTLCFVTWLGWVMTPTKKDCLMIVAGGAVGNFITQDSSAKALPADITRYLHLSLNKEIEDLSKETQSDIKKELGIKQTPKEEFVDKVKSMTKEQIIEYLQKDTTHLK